MTLPGPDDETLPPTRLEGPARFLGRYRVVRELARGGMGVVYVGHDPELDREVAIKQCLPMPSAGSATQHEEHQRFLREAKAVARLQHPHIVSVFDVGFADGASYIVMDLIQGESLQGRLKREGPLPEREVARLGVQIAQALGYAHQRAILHRDVKPHNVLLGEDGEPRLTDFGLAKVADLRDLETQLSGPDVRAALPGLAADASLTLTGALLGTPAYMPPEQAEGRAVDARADIYSLGATLYALLSGAPPHGRSSVINTLHAVLQQDAPALSSRRPGVDRGLEAIVMRCLARDPAARYGSCQELAAALSGWLKRPAPTAEGGSPLPLIAGGIVAVLAITAGLALREQPQPAPSAGVAVAAPSPTVRTPTTQPTPRTQPTPTTQPTPAPPPLPPVSPSPAPAPREDQPDDPPPPSTTPKPKGLTLERSFVWRAPIRHPWGRAPRRAGGPRVYALVARRPDRFIRLNRLQPKDPPVWRVEGDRVRLQRPEGRVALASPGLYIRRVARHEAQVREVESGKVRLQRVKHFSHDPKCSALSDAWIVQAYEEAGEWQVVARSTSSNPDFDHLVRYRPGARAIERVLIGERKVGLLRAGGELLITSLPDEEHLARYLSRAEPMPDRVNFRSPSRLSLNGKRPLAISPRDDLIAFALTAGRGLQLYDISRFAEGAWLKGTACAEGERTAQFSPDGKLFAWIDKTLDGTVHAVAVDDPQRRVSVPAQRGWVAFFWHADTSITVCTPSGVRRFELRR